MYNRGDTDSLVQNRDDREQSVLSAGNVAIGQLINKTHQERQSQQSDDGIGSDLNMHMLAQSKEHVNEKNESDEARGDNHENDNTIGNPTEQHVYMASDQDIPYDEPPRSKNSLPPFAH